MGQPQHSLSQPVSARPRALPLRSCLRRHCGHTFQPKRWKQRYCRDPECPRELRRWQATKRQRKRREQPEVRQRHAAAERKRRATQRQVACATENVPELRCLDPHQQACQPLPTTPEAFPAVPIEPLSTANPAMQQESQAHSGTNNCHEAREEVPATRLDADQAHETSAWSRRRKTFGPTCDRPGCYEPPRDSRSGLARYCSDDCHQAMRPLVIVSVSGKAARPPRDSSNAVWSTRRDALRGMPGNHDLRTHQTAHSVNASMRSAAIGHLSVPG